MDKMPRVNSKSHFLLFGAFAVFAGVFVGKDILPASYDNVPAVILPFLIAFLVAWFGFILFAFFHGLTALQTVSMNRDEIRVCIGPVVVRRITTDRIKTVGLSVEFGRGDVSPSMFYLVLSGKLPEELNEKGIRKLNKSYHCQKMGRAGVAPDGKYAAAKAYLFDNYLGAALWIEDSEEARQMLKKNLTTAVFLI